MEKISLFKNIWETIPIGEIGIEDMCRIIKDEALRPYTEHVRGASTKEEKQARKKFLPNVTVNGVFSQRGNTFLTSYSGMTCMDFDNIPDSEMLFIRDGLRRWPNSLVVFQSPSGTGYKLILRHDLKDPSLHWNLYGQLIRLFKDNYNCKYTDISVKDISRAMYLCYDPDCYLNLNAVPFYFEFDESIPMITKSSVSSVAPNTGTTIGMCASLVEKNQSYQEEWPDKSLINYIDKHQWSHFPEDYEEGHKNDSILRKAGQLYRCGVSFEAATEKLVHLYSHVFSDVPEHEVKNRVKYIYSQRSDAFGSQRNEWLMKRNEGISAYKGR